MYVSGVFGSVIVFPEINDRRQNVCTDYNNNLSFQVEYIKKHSVGMTFSVSINLRLSSIT